MRLLRYALATLFFVLFGCTQPTSPGPPSLQVAPPEYYSRTLHYIVRERYRGRTVHRTYDIPVRVFHTTGDVQVAPEEDALAVDTNRQLTVIQWRLDQAKRGLP